MDRQDLSGMLGAVSMASWLVVGVPQVFENWRNKNADGIAVSFLLIWLVGDTLSFIGGVLGRLIGTVILISCYFLVSDCVILSQTLYYQRYSRHARHHHRHHHHHHHPHAEQQESDALLPRRNSTTSVRQHRHRLTRMQRVLLQNLLCVVLVVVFGLVGFFVSKLQRGSSGGAGSPTAVTVASHGDITSVVSEVLGYASAVLYLLARVPQILKNYRKKSTEGLALLFFVFSVIGNVTYALSIVAYSSDRDYLIRNIPWLLGSAGTLVLDFTIFAQFALYANNASSSSSITATNTTTTTEQM